MALERHSFDRLELQTTLEIEKTKQSSARNYPVFLALARRR